MHGGKDGGRKCELKEKCRRNNRRPVTKRNRRGGERGRKRERKKAKKNRMRTLRKTWKRTRRNLGQEGKKRMSIKTKLEEEHQEENT